MKLLKPLSLAALTLTLFLSASVAEAKEDINLAGCSVELDSYFYNLIDLNRAK
jgi:hypothetical protein